MTEMQRLDVKNPDNPEDSSSARISRRDQPDRSQEIKKERCEKIDQTAKYLGGGGGTKKTRSRRYSTNHFQLKIYLHLLTDEIPKM
jgi:hypothetical protein